jgi:hypothetical protein
MRRHIESLELAVSFAERLRAERFHDHDNVIIVDDRTDAIVDTRAMGTLDGNPTARDALGDPLLLTSKR